MTLSNAPARPDKAPPRRRTNLTIRPDYIEAARRLDINMSEAAEQGLAEAIHKAEAAAWLAENGAALESANAWVAESGLPLAGKRLF